MGTYTVLDSDPSTWNEALRVDTLYVAPGPLPRLTWDAQSDPGLGPDFSYEVVGGTISALRATDIGTATDCVKGDLTMAQLDDTQPEPPAGDGYYYLVRARNACGAADFGPGLSSIEPLDCRGR